MGNLSELEQGSKEWFDARLGKITASRIHHVLSKPRSKGQKESTSRANYMAQIVCEILTGKSGEEEFENYHTKRGKELEPEARIEYELRTNADVQTVGFVEHPRIPRFGCSPDGLIGTDGLVQFKCPIPRVHYDYIEAKKLNIVPADYYAQVQCELACTGRKFNDFVSYNKQWPGHLQLIVIRAERDEPYIANLEAEVIKFNAEVDEMLAGLPKEEPCQRH